MYRKIGRSMQITKSLVKLILAAARDTYPHEFVAMLGGSKNTIRELIFLPFETGERAALIHTEMLPLGMKIYGTVHSHPSPNPRPSAEDLKMFSRYGKVHIIVCYPFNERSWKCFDRRGNEIDIEVVDE
jgi:proteasome lid subunit RPN8/RPN11